MFNKKINKVFYFWAILCFAFIMLLTFANDAQAIGACRFEVIAPTNGQVIYNNQSFPVKVKLIDCPKAYKIDYALVSLTIPSLKQVYEPNMLLGDFNTITLPSYSGDKVAKEFENCGSTHLVVSVWQCVNPSDYTGGVCYSFNGTDKIIPLNFACSTSPTTPPPTTPDARYSCNQSTGQCYADSNGYYTSLSFCNSVCEKPSSRYSCNTSTGQCYVDSFGVYTSLDYCNLACEKDTPQTKYSCNQSTGQCYADSFGNYFSLSLCNSFCQKDTPQTRYSCNQSTGQCYADSNGYYTSLSSCNSNCTKYTPPTTPPYYPPQTRYSCDTYSGQCYTSASGIYTSLSTCNANCNPYVPPTSPQSRYSCNSVTGQCYVDTYGAYTSLSTCNSNCNPYVPPTSPQVRYSCNATSGQCYTDNNGVYLSLSNCQNNCYQKITTRYSCNVNSGQCYTDNNGAYTSLSTCQSYCNIQKPTVNLEANPLRIQSGSNTILSWSSNNATYCIASNGWSGTKSLNGNESRRLTQTTTFTITCYNGSQSASDSVTVSVDDGNPYVNLYLDRNVIRQGESTILHWDSYDVNYCYADSNPSYWSGNKSTNGSETVSPSQNTQFTITCYGTNGQTVTDTAYLEVDPYYHGPNYNYSNPISVDKKVRNITRGEYMFVESTNARSGEYVEYEIVIRNNSNSTIQNVVVYDPIPTPLMYVTGSTKINGITNVDGIATSGIILGTLKPQQTVTINLNAYLYSNTNVYSMLLNKVQVRSNNYSEVIDSASVVVNAMYGSGYIETGPWDTFWALIITNLLVATGLWFYLTKNEKGKELVQKIKKSTEKKKLAKQARKIK